MTLYEFVQNNKDTLKELREYFNQVLREKAIEKVFDTGEAPAVKEAKEIIDEAFENIEIQFSKKPKAKKQINEAR
jgi:hypothetical protein